MAESPALPACGLCAAHSAAQVDDADKALRGRRFRGKSSQIPPLLRPRAVLPRPCPGSASQAKAAQTRNARLSETTSDADDGAASGSAHCEAQQCDQDCAHVRVGQCDAAGEPRHAGDSDVWRERGVRRVDAVRLAQGQHSHAADGAAAAHRAGHATVAGAGGGAATS